METGERVASWRRIRHLTVRSLADQAEMAYSSLSRIEKGHQQARADELERLAKAMGLSMAEFYGAEAGEKAVG